MLQENQIIMKSNIYHFLILIGIISITLFTSNIVKASKQQVFLSDLNWESASIGWGAIHRDLSIVGNVITLNDVVFDKGIGTHAVSDISYWLDGSCSTFQTYIGVDDEVLDNNTNSNIEFNVYGDDNLLYASGVMTPTSPTQFIDIDISGISILRLSVGDVNGSNNADHADWADAQVTVSGNLPPSLIRIISPISINSSNDDLVDMFDWAKNKAYSFVQTGDGNNIPSYWAGILDRPAFYLRDVAHQAIGANLLELDEENYAMIQTFAQSATFSRKYYPIWAFNFDGSIYYLDYNNDDNFVREVPQAFEMTEQAINLYRWTGDDNYINDEEMFDFYTNSVTEFVNLHDNNDNGIADDNWSQQGDIFLGTCTYNEQSTDNFIEASDGLAAQYRAYLAYAEILAARGNTVAYEIWMNNAEILKNKFETDWYQSNQYVRGFKIDGNYGSGFAQMHISYPSRAGITDMAEKNEAALDLLFANYQSVYYVEARSYDAEIYFQYNQAERGWVMMNNVFQDNRRNYPEISYVLVANCITGMMGIDADAPNNKIMSCPRLPEDIDWLEVDSVKIGEQYLYVKHESNTKTILTNKSDETINWQAQFYGGYSKLLHNETPVNATLGDLYGQEITYINLELQPNQTDVVEADPVYLGFNNYQFHQNPSVFPNPAEDKLSINIRKGAYKIEVCSVAGEIVKSKYLQSSDLITIDISDLKSGIYFVNIIGSDFSDSNKFMKL